MEVTRKDYCEVKSYRVYFSKGYVIAVDGSQLPCGSIYPCLTSNYHILRSYGEKLAVQHTGKTQQLSIGRADRDSRGLLRTGAETVEKHRKPVFVDCKGLILLGTISWKRARMELFESLES